MIVRVVKGDLFESDFQTLVNPVNCAGIMGKGLAKQFKERFPEMFKKYEILCENEEVQLGEPYLCKRTVLPWILNFPTKDHWRSNSKIGDIEEGLEFIEKHYVQWGVDSLAVPALGCGSGQLDWKTVGPILYDHLDQLDIEVELYASYEAPETQLKSEYLQDGNDLE